jgi:hypothetical protein
MTSTNEPLKGECLCGAVHVEISGDLERRMECHCAECQRVMGGGPAYIAMVERSKAAISGEVKGYTVKGDSGGDVTRFFCPECGTPTHSELEKYPSVYVFKVGLFGPRSASAPQFAIWMGSAPEWHPVAGDIPRFDAAPPPRG